MGQPPAGTGMGAREVYREIILDNIEYEYLVQDDHIDREQLDEMLLALRDADNNPLYTQKTLDGWVSDAEKKSKAQTSDPWADLR